MKDGWRLHSRVSRRYIWPWLVGYARGKLMFDPAYGAVYDRIGDSTQPLLDIGCGMGVLAFYLRERGFVPRIEGVDVDEKKVQRGSRVAKKHYPGVHLAVGDGAHLPEFSGNVTLLDVLHYLPVSEQERMLREMAARVAPGCWCIIRTTPKDGSWRYKLTVMEERFARAISWMTTDAHQFPTIAGIQEQFPPTEFEAQIRPLWGKTPFNSWLLAFRRRA